MRNVFGILLLALLVYFIATQPLLAAETTTSAAGSLKSVAMMIFSSCMGISSDSRYCLHASVSR